MASLLCWSAVAVRAAKVDTVEVHSRKMGRAVRTIVISPEKTEGKGAAVVYLLHGYGGNETTWPGLKPELKDYADRENLIFVCPNGENSWYWDSPLNEDSQFETFVSRELVSYVDGHYRTLPSREKRAITGLSMGGHTPSGCFRSGGQYERRTGHPAFSGQLGHEGANRGKRCRGVRLGRLYRHQPDGQTQGWCPTDYF